jgi:hypothetical protein
MILFRQSSLRRQIVDQFTKGALSLHTQLRRNKEQSHFSGDSVKVFLPSTRKAFS